MPAMRDSEIVKSDRGWVMSMHKCWNEWRTGRFPWYIEILSPEKLQ